MVRVRGARLRRSHRTPLPFLSPTPSQRLCSVCLSNPKTVILLPCGHLCVCEDCAKQLLAARPGPAKCPIGREVVKEMKVAFV